MMRPLSSLPLPFFYTSSKLLKYFPRIELPLRSFPSPLQPRLKIQSILSARRQSSHAELSEHEPGAPDLLQLAAMIYRFIFQIGCLTMLCFALGDGI